MKNLVRTALMVIGKLHVERDGDSPVWSAGGGLAWYSTRSLLAVSAFLPTDARGASLPLSRPAATETRSSRSSTLPTPEGASSRADKLEHFKVEMPW